MPSAASSARPQSENSHALMANAIRFLAMDAVEKAQSGHPGMPMGMADVATVLFRDFLQFDPSAPTWPNRDRFILSGGHGSMLLYALLHLTGSEEMTIEELKRFRQLGSLTPGHPEYGHTKGVETTTGPLGQGFANAVGFALAEKILSSRFGESLVNHHTYVMLGDGDLMEGLSHEAASLAGHLKLNKLIALFDDNQISIDGPTSLSISDDHLKRFESYGWNVVRIDGHDEKAISDALANAQTASAPSFIACRTIIGFGAPNKGGKSSTHGSPLGASEIAATREALGWNHPAFEIPEAIYAEWKKAGERSRSTRLAWENTFKNSPQSAEFSRSLNGTLPKELSSELASFKENLVKAGATATRSASGMILEKLSALLPELIGGSADLTPSNNTQTPLHRAVTANDLSGRYIHYGVREHAMCGTMNGMALHGGIIPYGGTFLVFSDYCRPSIRLAALMKQRVIFVMTHDSIGLGEDGPTHQPVEHIASLRAIPGLYVFRPADSIETLEAWEIVLSLKAPSLLALTRQKVPLLRDASDKENKTHLGAYILEETNNAPAVTFWATGSEVAIAKAAKKSLEEKNISARVISVPCAELFAQQSIEYQQTLRRKNSAHIVIEAGIKQGWSEIIEAPFEFIGMNQFGVSAPFEHLYTHFGITAENAVTTALKILKS